MATLNSEQRRVLSRIKGVGREVGATPKEIKAAIETGLVESNLRNLPGGDADSAGWRQERASLYKDPTNLTASIRRFFSETRRVRDQYGSSGSLAAAVQRPAAQYRGRYGQRSGEASALLGSGDTSTPGRGSARARMSSVTTPGIDNSAARQQALQSFLSQDNGDILDFALQIRGLQDTPATTRNVAAGTGARLPGGMTDAGADTLTRRANAIDAQRLPYKWGGGHGGKTSIHTAVPLDCSGAVSKVLNIDPRVADQFKGWGSPGDGGNKGVTIYSSPSHVLMKINGHFFGTSATNPGGGAGWIPQGAISKQYLSKFTARHSKNLG